MLNLDALTDPEKRIVMKWLNRAETLAQRAAELATEAARYKEAAEDLALMKELNANQQADEPPPAAPNDVEDIKEMFELAEQSGDRIHGEPPELGRPHGESPEAQDEG